MFKKEKGITLVALVVTIIILLILAGVALSIAIGENGLFHYSQNAADTYRRAEANEQSELTAATDKMIELIEKYHLEDE